MSPESNPKTKKKLQAALPGMVAGLVNLVLLAAALRDLRQRTEEEINGNKRVWYGVVFVRFIGPVAYFIFGRKRETSALPAPESVDASRLAEA